jgi:kexin
MINPDDPDWEDTAIGRRFSYKYGYGSLDAYAFVKAAQSWTLVKPQGWLMMDAIQLEDGVMTAEGEMSGGQLIGEGGVTSKMTITRELLTEHNFGTLEHVTIKVWISHTRRGEVEIELISPSGVRSMLAGKRKYDLSDEGFPGWTFMTVKHW